MRYFPDLAENEAMLVRNPFSSTIGIESIPDEVQDQFIDMRNDSTALEIFQEKSLTELWCRMYPSYPAVSLIAFSVLPFPSTYLCEAGFSSLLQIKNKARNKVDVENDMRLALSKKPPRIARLVARKQPQSSH